MIRRDYILRMIEEFMQVLARINFLKKGQLWQQADDVIEQEFRRLVSAGAQAVAEMNETDLLAKIIEGEPTAVVHSKVGLMAALLYEAGDVRIAQNQIEEGHAFYLNGLNLLLETLANSEAAAFPEFVPEVESFVIALQDAPLPLSTLAGLMQHYERGGQFAKAEDALFRILEAGPNEPKLLEFGLAFYQRLQSRPDANLAAGDLPRDELNAGIAELTRRKVGLVQP